MRSLTLVLGRPVATHINSRLILALTPIYQGQVHDIFPVKERQIEQEEDD